MKDPVLLQRLEKEGLVIRYHEAPLETISQTNSNKNQARIIPISPEYVQELMKSMRNGAVFPAFVAWRPSDRSHWILCDGNSRLAAMMQIEPKYRPKTHDLYEIVSSDREVIDRITFKLNMFNGRRPSEEDLLAHAKDMIRLYNWTQQRAAEEFEIAVWKLRKSITVEDNHAIMDEFHVKNHKNLPEEKVVALNPLKELDKELMAKAAAVVIDNGADIKQIDELVKEVKAAPLKEKVKVIDDWNKKEEIIEQRAATKGGKVQNHKKQPRDLYAAWLRAGYKIITDYPDKKSRQPRGSDYEELNSKSKKLINDAITVFGHGPLLKEIG